MAGLFGFLLLLTLGLLIWSLISPAKFARRFDKKDKHKLSRKHFGIGFSAIVIGLIVLIGITSPKQPNTNQSIKLTTAKSQPANQITTKTETDTKPVPFTSTTVDDSSLDNGTSNVTTAGVNGVETLTYKITLTNGDQTSKQLVSDVVTTKPVTQVTTVGTYIAPSTPTGCTNGTYVNSAGNTVCSPESSSTAPAGATAQCVDGTYSFSQSRSGTCSHHGGVAQWLN
jgi:hypothetical protein